MLSRLPAAGKSLPRPEPAADALLDFAAAQGAAADANPPDGPGPPPGLLDGLLYAWRRVPVSAGATCCTISTAPHRRLSEAELVMVKIRTGGGRGAKRSSPTSPPPVAAAAAGAPTPARGATDYVAVSRLAAGPMAIGMRRLRVAICGVALMYQQTCSTRRSCPERHQNAPQLPLMALPFFMWRRDHYRRLALQSHRTIALTLSFPVTSPRLRPILPPASGQPLGLGGSGRAALRRCSCRGLFLPATTVPSAA